MSKKFTAALIILPILAVASHIGMRLYQVKQANQLADELRSDKCYIGFEENRILFFIPTEIATEAHISAYSKISPDILEKLRYFPDLDKISLKLYYASDADLKTLHAVKNLKVLDLSRTNVTDEGMPFLAKLPSLESLNLSCTGVTDEGMSALAKSSTLKWLGLSFTTVSDEGVRRLPKTVEISAAVSKITGRTISGWSLSKLSDLKDAPVPSDELIQPLQKLLMLLDSRYNPSHHYIISMQKSTSPKSGKPYLITIEIETRVNTCDDSIRKQQCELIREISKHADVAIEKQYAYDYVSRQYYNNEKMEELENDPEFNTMLEELCKLDLIHLTPDSDILTSEQLEMIWRCKTLESVKLSGYLPETITLPSHLLKVDICDCDMVREIDIDGEDPALKEINLQCVPATGIAFLAKCRHLEKLSISRLSVPCDLSPLSELSELTELSLDFCNDKLDVDSIQRCKTLRKLDIHFEPEITGLSKERKIELRSSMPDTTIVIK